MGISSHSIRFWSGVHPRMYMEDALGSGEDIPGRNLAVFRMSDSTSPANEPMSLGVILIAVP